MARLTYIWKCRRKGCAVTVAQRVDLRMDKDVEVVHWVHGKAHRMKLDKVEQK